MNRPPRFLVPEPIGDDARASAWSAAMAAASRAGEALASVDQTRAAPEASVRTRAAILSAAYRGDYHTDTEALDRLAASVRDGEERIFFWGARDEIGRWQAGARDGTMPALHLELGTATFLDRSRVFGAGVWELSRTGSTAPRAGASAPNMRALLDHAASAGGAGGARVIYSTPRNSGPSARAPSGVAIHRMHVRDIRTTFLGLAPWYRMAGGVIEILDFRAFLPDRTAAGRLLEQAPPAAFRAAEDAALFEAIVQAAGFPVRRAADAAYGVDDAGPRFLPPVSLHPETAEMQPVFVGPATTGGVPIEAALAGLADRPSCAIVRLPLDARSGPAQARLGDAGFRFCAIELPYAPADPWMGHWCRVRAGLPVARPYYLDRALPAPEDAALAAALRALAARCGWLEEGA